MRETIIKNKVGFTGTQCGMTYRQKSSFEKLIKMIYVSEFHHGDCVGADTEAQNIVKKESTAIAIHIHPPKDPSRRAFNKSDYIFEEKEYLERNHDIVDAANVLIATPKTFIEQQRSGTWATIRYARKMRKSIFIIKPDGAVAAE